MQCIILFQKFINYVIVVFLVSTLKLTLNSRVVYSRRLFSSIILFKCLSLFLTLDFWTLSLSSSLSLSEFLCGDKSNSLHPFIIRFPLIVFVRYVLILISHSIKLISMTLWVATDSTNFITKSRTHIVNVIIKWNSM